VAKSTPLRFLTVGVKGFGFYFNLSSTSIIILRVQTTSSSILFSLCVLHFQRSCYEPTIRVVLEPKHQTSKAVYQPLCVSLTCITRFGCNMYIQKSLKKFFKSQTEDIFYTAYKSILLKRSQNYRKKQGSFSCILKYLYVLTYMHVLYTFIWF